MAANFVMVFIGLETPAASSLECAGKRQNLLLDPALAVEAIQKKGIEVSGGFIIGFDADPPGICDEQIRFVKELAVPMAMVGLLTALPRTALRDRLEREGRLLAQSTGDNTHSATFNFRTVQPEGSAPGRLLPRPRRDLPSTRLLRPLPRVPSALPRLAAT